jgi:hypothetical protein
MATIALPLVGLSVSENELKLLLIALDSFHHQLKNKSTRSQALIRIFHSEKFLNIDFDTRSLITD